jgi:two-component system sensor histidine kinase HydH
MLPSAPQEFQTPVSSPPANVQQFQHEALTQLFGAFVGARLAFTPLVTLLPLWVVLTETTLWRRITLALLVVFLVMLSWVELQRFQRHGLRPYSILLNLASSAALQLVAILVTGGIESPLLPTMVPMVVLLSVFYRPGLVRRLIIGTQVAALWALLLIERTGWIPDLLPVTLQGESRMGSGRSGVYLLVYTSVMTLLLLLVARQIGTRLRDIYDATFRRAIEARDDTLRTYAENLQLLTTLSAEIAHELKNPLGSIKGLTTLIARDVEGKTAERMKVLRQETDRMQGILEGFLNFSRPLGPLAQEQVNLRELCQSILVLHEGLAAERRLTLRLLPGEPLVVCCDTRKVKQILINLLQNALEASPPGQEVLLELAPLDHQRVRISVLDRGPGLPMEQVERLFQVGVTSKPQGSGLGLTIARTLARQHGGDVTLHPREGGGCHAMLHLPLRQEVTSSEASHAVREARSV